MNACDSLKDMEGMMELLLLETYHAFKYTMKVAFIVIERESYEPSRPVDESER